MSTRMNSLLKMAADKFDDLSNPFDGSVLREHHITADECYDLSTGIASIIRAHLDAPKDLRLKLMVNHAFKDAGIDPQGALDALRMDEALKKLKDL